MIATSSTRCRGNEEAGILVLACKAALKYHRVTATVPIRHCLRLKEPRMKGHLPSPAHPTAQATLPAAASGALIWQQAAGKPLKQLRCGGPHGRWRKLNSWYCCRRRTQGTPQSQQQQQQQQHQNDDQPRLMSKQQLCCPLAVLMKMCKGGGTQLLRRRTWLPDHQPTIPQQQQSRVSCSCASMLQTRSQGPRTLRGRGSRLRLTVLRTWAVACFWMKAAAITCAYAAMQCTAVMTAFCTTPFNNCPWCVRPS
mmetsp:Transcript_5292/g.14226  ORF Transcript_5292/g.14226 Transcript_5292/m.14226 type:complete len:253 (+) Transcript_5292:168-926(+)